MADNSSRQQKRRRGILVRCTPEQAALIRQAAEVERRTLSDFVLNAVLEKIPPEIPPDDMFDDEMAVELAQFREEMRSLLLEGMPLEKLLPLIYDHYADFTAIGLARARQRVARAQKRLTRIAQRRERAANISARQHDVNC